MLKQKTPTSKMLSPRMNFLPFWGTTFYMSLFGMTNTRRYWSVKRIGLIADNITQKRWEEIKSNLHFVDNTSLTPESGRLAKILPIITKFNETARSIDPDQHCSVDENTIPYKGKKSKLRQYNPKKPNKWGCKLFMLCSGKFGIIRTVELYTGKDVKGKETGASQLLKSSQVVARLFETLPSDCNFKVAFDNWFSSVGLMKVLALRKIY